MIMMTNDGADVRKVFHYRRLCSLLKDHEDYDDGDNDDGDYDNDDDNENDDDFHADDHSVRGDGDDNCNTAVVVTVMRLLVLSKINILACSLTLNITLI